MASALYIHPNGRSVKTSLPARTVVAVIEAYEAGSTAAEAAQEAGVSTSLAHRWLKTLDISRNRREALRARYGTDEERPAADTTGLTAERCGPFPGLRYPDTALASHRDFHRALLAYDDDNRGVASSARAGGLSAKLFERFLRLNGLRRPSVGEVRRAKRRRAAQLFESDMSNGEIARAVGVTLTSIVTWRKLWHAGTLV